MSVILENLGFNPIKEIIKFRDNEGVEQTITIYNPNEEKQKEIQSVLLQYTDVKNKKLVVPPIVTIKEIISRLTDIKIPKDEKIINKIFANPSLVLQKTMVSVIEIIGEIQEVNLRLLNVLDKLYGLSNLSNDEIVELLSKQDKLEGMINEFEIKLENEDNDKAKKNKKVKKEASKKKSDTSTKTTKTIKAKKEDNF
ncbi:hypothetical protein [Clostridium rectalis]|uniref:hypothetical protein n=1 Tax=Clostridium rectalis TaxID=2040295 RepID=UPI000F641AC3|nr:hypothetical protein [Clostridium rectalis]